MRDSKRMRRRERRRPENRREAKKQRMGSKGESGGPRARSAKARARAAARRAGRSGARRRPERLPSGRCELRVRGARARGQVGAGAVALAAKPGRLPVAGGGVAPWELRAAPSGTRRARPGCLPRRRRRGARCGLGGRRERGV